MAPKAFIAKANPVAQDAPDHQNLPGGPVPPDPQAAKAAQIGKAVPDAPINPKAAPAAQSRPPSPTPSEEDSTLSERRDAFVARSGEVFLVSGAKHEVASSSSGRQLPPEAEESGRH